jgi:hypothetical protein
MEPPTRHVNLAMLQKQQDMNRYRQLTVAAAKTGHTANGNQYGSKYDMNFWNEYGKFHALKPNYPMMNEVRPRKVIRKAK